MVVNSAALAELHIDETTLIPRAGTLFVICPRPINDDQTAFWRRLRHITREKNIGFIRFRCWQMTKLASAEYLEYGVTTASAGVCPRHSLAFWVQCPEYNQIPLRVALFPWFNEVGTELVSGEVTLSEFSGGRVVVPRVKIIADGSIQGFTGYLSQPYHRPYKGDADYRGYPSVLREALFEQVEGLYRQRVQVAIHGNGDASIEDALDAIEAAASKYPWPEARPLIIHAQMTRKDQIDRMAALGVTPSFFAAHTFFWGDRHAGIFMGPERAANMSPAKWAQDAGVRFPRTWIRR